MITLMTCSPQILCAILSKPKTELTPMELAAREALESANSADELEAIRQASCIKGAIGQIVITKSGRVHKI